MSQEITMTNESNEVATLSNGISNFNELLNLSEKVDKMKPQVTLTADYIELEKPSESFSGVFIGLQVMGVTDKATGEQKELVAARFLINKKVYINAGVTLVNELKRASVPVGTPLQVTYIRKEGNAKIYEIALLG
jgi:hypothetical protein